MNKRVPVLHLRTDADLLRLMGFTPQDVAQQLQLQLDGAPFTEFRCDTRSVDLVARRGFLGRRPDPQALAGLELLNRDGSKVPAAQLATLEVRYEEPVIKRYNREPFVAVQGETRGAQPNDVTGAVWQALESVSKELPAGYRVAIGGSVEQSAKGEASIQKLQPLMVATMLLFIMLQMRSFAGTFMMVATASLGLIGAVLALLTFNKPFGFVALFWLTGLPAS
jgi:multidrug efflux pump subunit AcrB